MVTEAQQLSGQVIAGYRLLHPIGSGGGSVVYLGERLEQPAPATPDLLSDLAPQRDLDAFDTLDRFDAEQTLDALDALDAQDARAAEEALRAQLVAFKIRLPLGAAAGEGASISQARFTREAAIVGKLRHPHIAPMLDYGEQDDVRYIIFPYYANGSLINWLASRPAPITLVEIARYLDELADALDYAHERGVIHRDVKLSNVLVDANGALLLTDFGVAALFENGLETLLRAGDAATLTRTGETVGTPTYMAPEQLSLGKLTPATDVYSLGATIYQLVTGRPPFQADSLLAMAMLHLQEPPAPPSHVRPELPPAAEAAILRALAKQPADRFASAGAFARAFSAGLAGHWIEGLTPALAGGGQMDLAATTPATPAPLNAQHTAITPDAANAHAPTWPDGASSGAVAITPAAIQAAHAIAPTRRLPRSTRARIGRALVGTLIAAIILAVSLAGLQQFRRGGFFGVFGVGGTPTAASSSPFKASIPAGKLRYGVTAPGRCDSGGATWTWNTQARQQCNSGNLLLSAPNCQCSLGLVRLQSLPTGADPTEYVAQAQVEAIESSNVDY
ncbi:MAG: serine/threonine-protein kinase, partial [Ktedonobacterales bacterium]